MRHLEQGCDPRQSGNAQVAVRLQIGHAPKLHDALRRKQPDG
jgi:hypothetical protein